MIYQKNSIKRRLFYVNMKIWKLKDEHKQYGEVIAMGIRDREPYRFFKNKEGVISLIPLACLQSEIKE